MMFTKKALLILGFLAFTLPSWADTYHLDDTYIGEDDHSYGDVIGDAGYFDIFGLDVTLENSLLTVAINTNFAGRGDDGLFSNYTYDEMGIGYGDLFLGTGYPDTPADPYMGWQYGFALDDRYSKTGGEATLYALNPAGDPFLESGDFLKNAIYRDGQVVAVDTDSASASVIPSLLAGTWSVDQPNKLLTFSMDLAGTELLSALRGGEDLALHWGMTCANDVIEGEVDIQAVPLPAAAWLFASGLLGLVGFSRRKKA